MIFKVEIVFYKILQIKTKIKTPIKTKIKIPIKTPIKMIINLDQDQIPYTI